VNDPLEVIDKGWPSRSDWQGVNDPLEVIDKGW